MRPKHVFNCVLSSPLEVSSYSYCELWLLFGKASHQNIFPQLLKDGSTIKLRFQAPLAALQDTVNKYINHRRIKVQVNLESLNESIPFCNKLTLISPKMNPKPDNYIWKKNNQPVVVPQYDNSKMAIEDMANFKMHYHKENQDLFFQSKALKGYIFSLKQL